MTLTFLCAWLTWQSRGLLVSVSVSGRKAITKPSKIKTTNSTNTRLETHTHTQKDGDGGRRDKDLCLWTVNAIIHTRGFVFYATLYCSLLTPETCRFMLCKCTLETTDSRPEFAADNVVRANQISIQPEKPNSPEWLYAKLKSLHCHGVGKIWWRVKLSWT